MDKEKVFSNWLCNIEGIGRKTRWRLLDEAGTAVDIYNMKECELKQFLNPRQYSRFAEYRERTEPEELYRKLMEKGIAYYPFSDSQFPERLRVIPDPPTGIYVMGNLPGEKEHTVAVIGARECSEYGRYTAAGFAGALAEAGISIVSGLARGIDGISQENALYHGGKTYAVMGGGVDICYPKENMELYEQIPFHGGILSEMPPGTMPAPGLFPQRNRIISGLAELVLVVEAREKSGTFITVDMALEQGKEVAVIPGRITDRLSLGCNRLLRQGAAVVLEPADILQMLEGGTEDNRKGNCVMKNEKSSVREEWQKVYQVLDFYPQSVSRLCSRAEEKGESIPVPELMNILMELLAAGICLQDGGQFYLKG